MKIPPHSIATFLQNPPAGLVGVLFYGPDQGQVALLKKKFEQALQPQGDDPFNSTTLSFDQLKDNPYILEEALLQLPFGAKKRLIRLEGLGATLSAGLQAVLKKEYPDAIVVAACGELGPSATTRKFFESTPHLAAIACYQEESTSLRRHVASFLREENISCSTATLETIVQLIGPDRLVIKQELEKLALFKATDPQRELLPGEVFAILGNSQEALMEDFCNAFGLIDRKDVLHLMERLLASGTMPIVLIRALLRHLQRLLQAQQWMQEGVGLKQAITQLKPPVFFKQVPLFEQQLRTTSFSSLMTTVKALIQLEMDCKKSAFPATLSLQHFVLTYML